MVVPDMNAEVRVDFDDGSAVEHFFLGDIRNIDGSSWECCPREFLRRAIAALDAASGLHLIAAFEQEFVYTGWRSVLAMLTASAPGGGRARSAKASLPRFASPGSSLTPSCPNMARANTS